ncbi:MAG TPA: SDR family oxidoreductase [Actinomycetota bacterium]
MIVLVTGGTGFIGSNLVRCLLGAGASVRVLDDLSTGRQENLDGLNGGLDIVVGDVRDGELLASVVRGTEVVYHLAALPSVARSIADPVATHDVNATGTLKVLLSARDAGARRVVYASSSSVYGDTPTLPKHEGMPVAPLSPYAASKLAGEAYCRSFTRSFSLETVALRFFNVFGPRQDPASQYAAVIPRFVNQVLQGESPTVFGDGEQSRDFTYIGNVVQACVLAAEAAAEASGRAMNVGFGRRTTLLELIQILGRIVGREIEPAFAPPRPGDVRDSLADISMAERLIGYRPLMDLRGGLTETVEWFERARRRIAVPARSMEEGER